MAAPLDPRLIDPSGWPASQDGPGASASSRKDIEDPLPAIPLEAKGVFTQFRATQNFARGNTPTTPHAPVAKQAARDASSSPSEEHEPEGSRGRQPPAIVDMNAHDKEEVGKVHSGGDVASSLLASTGVTVREWPLEVTKLGVPEPHGTLLAVQPPSRTAHWPSVFRMDSPDAMLTLAFHMALKEPSPELLKKVTKAHAQAQADFIVLVRQDPLEEDSDEDVIAFLAYEVEHFMLDHWMHLLCGRKLCLALDLDDTVVHAYDEAALQGLATHLREAAARCTSDLAKLEQEQHGKQAADPRCWEELGQHRMACKQRQSVFESRLRLLEKHILWLQ
eukprot:gene6847-8178_t